MHKYGVETIGATIVENIWINANLENMVEKETKRKLGFLSIELYKYQKTDHKVLGFSSTIRGRFIKVSLKVNGRSTPQITIEE